MNHKLPFVSPALKKIDAEAEDIISTRLNHLDRLTTDIRALEERLKSAAIPFTFVYVLSSVMNRSDENPYYDDYTGHILQKTLIEIEEHCLVWGKSERDDYRLNYQIFITKDEDKIILNNAGEETDRITESIGKPTLIFSKPVLETKSQVRIQIENELPHFYNLIVNSLKTDSHKDLITELSLNNIDLFLTTVMVKHRGIN